ncbi:MAG: phospholipid/cholesterol/gamma-HCH transport system substrate-binding protein [Actinomycetota bacterium]|jgi:phospholipid/cholesterol/gamma-HCH transport system substrate-binding protein
MKSFRDRNPYMVAAASLLAMTLILLSAIAIKPITHRGNFPISAEFSDAAGVSTGAPVRVAGVQVGLVTSVRADRQHGLVVIRMSINHGVRLGPTTRAEVALATLLGAKYVRLSGEVKEPVLKKNAVIPNDRTATPYDIFEIAKQSTHRIEETHNEELNTLIKQLSTITDGKQQSIQDLIHGIGKVADAIGQRDAQLSDLIDRANTISNTLATKDQTLVTLLDQSDGLLKVLANRHDQVAEGIHQASIALGQLAGVVSTHKAELDSILDTLHPTVDILDRHQSDLDRALSWIGEGSYGLALSSSHGPWGDVLVRSLGPDVVALLGALANPGSTP